MIIVKRKKFELLELFKEKLNQESILYEINQIYEKIESDSSRTIFFFSHKKKFSDLNLILKELDSKNNINMFEVKQYLVLKEERCLNEAL